MLSFGAPVANKYKIMVDNVGSMLFDTNMVRSKSGAGNVFRFVLALETSARPMASSYQSPIDSPAYYCFYFLDKGVGDCQAHEGVYPRDRNTKAMRLYALRL